MDQGLDSEASRPANRLLRALDPELFEAVRHFLEVVDLSARDPVYERGQPIDQVYFPIDAVVSVVADMSDGAVIEVATVGREGIVGIPALLQAENDEHRAFTQVPGRALRLSTPRFLELVEASKPFERLLHRYIQALITQISRSAACNRVHSIDERAGRWLLLTHDRAGRDEFPLTQEFLAQMLGVRRPSVTTAAGMLQKAGLIKYSRGRVTVVDREGLENASCECYRVIRDEYERLVG
jgi:CRP-like cAMP-binding protein